jgi:hypothetical protein
VEQVEEDQEQPASLISDAPVQPIPVMQAAPPPSQPLPEAEEIPGAFPEEDKVKETEQQVKEEAIPAPVPAPEPVAAPAPTSAPIARSIPPAQPKPTLPLQPEQPTRKDDAAEPSKLSFKDRLAAFNSPSSSPSKQPAPPLKPKPAGGLTWSQKQKMREEEEKKERESNPVSPASQALAQVVASTEEGKNDTAAQIEEKKGMSASDAKASIGQGLSLKERMAALAGSQAFGGASAGPKSPTPQEEGQAEKKVWKRPEPVEGGLPIPGQMPMPVRANSGQSVRSVNDGETEQETEQVPRAEGEEDEETKEKERRAAIAARMARLGGRGMFGGPPPVVGPKPGATKQKSVDSEPVAPQAEDTPAALPDVAIRPPQPQAPTVSEPAAPTPEPVAPGGGIAMPSIPRRAARPGRRGGATSTGPSRSGSLQPEETTPKTEGGQLATETPAAPGMVADQARQDSTNDGQIAIDEDLGSGNDGVKGAEAAGIALASPPAQVQQETQQREVQDELDAAGDDPARHAEGPALIGAEGGADAGFRGIPSEAITQEPVGRVERMPPPPIPAGAGFGSDEEEEEDDDDEDDLLRQAKSGQIHAQPSRLDVEEGIPAQPEEVEVVSPRSPVAFAPLHSPAAEVPSDRKVEHVVSPVSNTFAGLGLPKDEIELKHEHEAEEAQYEQEEDDEDDEAPPPPPRLDRPADRPSGPRPMPPRPTQEVSEEPSVMEPRSSRVPLPRPPMEEDDIDAPAPPPRRQDTLPPADNNIVTSSGPASTLVQEPIMQPPSAADEESTRRQTIAARMAKLGGIKLGGAPIGGFHRRQDSSGSNLQSPVGEDMPQTPRSPIRETPGTPMQAVVEPEQERVADEDESEDAAAARRRATLARLQAGGRLGGFNMFNRSVEPGSPGLDEPAQVEAPVADERNLQPEQVREVEIPSQGGVEDEEDEENEDDVPPPPPARTSVLMSPPQTPRNLAPSSPMLERSATSGSITSPISMPTHIGSKGLAPPIPLLPETEGFSSEPVLLTSTEEVREDDDELGPPPPPRPTEPTRPVGGHQRSDSRASRISISSRRSTSNTPVSPTVDRRTSMQGGRPGFNELQQAASTYGTKVYRAASKLAESGKRQTIGVSLGVEVLLWVVGEWS